MKCNPNDIPMIVRSVVAILLSLTLTPWICQADSEDGEARVELRDGQVLHGLLRQIKPSRFLVQSDEQLYEISGEEIASVNGRPGTPEVAASSGRLLRYETYEIVAANGDLELWSTMHLANESSRVWTYVQWGAKERELPMFHAMQAFDHYGNRLEHRIEPRKKSGLYDVTVDLVVPIAPGEEVTLAQRLERPGAAEREGDTFTLSFGGDFPEDRIYLRKLRLPRGAQVERVEPEPTLEFEHEGSRIIVWRRYYPRQIEFPLTVVYRLAGD